MAALKPNTKSVATPSHSVLRGCLGRLIWFGVALLVCGAAAVTAGYWWLDATLPDVFSWNAYRQIAKESSRVYAAGGEVVARFGEEVRTVIPAERMPPLVRYAMICAEDAAFYDHPGLDFAGIARALWVDATTGRYAQGASTITQQFAKTRYLDREKTVTRKLKELVLARKLEAKLTKDEILTLYLNEVYFGHGRYGIEEAARFFFGRSAFELDVAQAALLAGMVNSPSRFSPLRHPDRAKSRRSYVLKQLHKHKYISQADLEKAEAQPLPTGVSERWDDIGPWYIEAVRRQVLGKVDRDQLANAGLRIEIAMDAPLQKAAEQAVRDGLQRIDRHYAVAVPQRWPTEEAIGLALAKLAATQKGKPTPGTVWQGVALDHDDERKAWRIGLGETEGYLGDSDLERYLVWPASKPSGKDAALAKDQAKPQPMRLQHGDQIRVSVRELTPDGITLSPEMGPQAALVAIEPQTRLVRVLVGGDDFDLHPFDRTRALRQPGSTFKTFTYGAAIEAGLVGPDTEMKDEKRTYKVAGKSWSPRNFSGGYDGRAYSLRDALAHSINSIAVEVASQTGPDKVAHFAQRAGVTSPLVLGLPLALGASSVTPMELTNAYATLASGGKHASPILITRIVDRNGKDLYLAPRDNATTVISGAVARQLVDMLGEVVRKGSAKDAQGAGRPIAGKTGTSNGSRDTWFVGFSAELCAGVWVGYDDRKPMPKGTGGALAVPIFTQFFKTGMSAVPVSPLPRLPHALAGPLTGLPVPAADVEVGAADLDDLELMPERPAGPSETLPFSPRKRPPKIDEDAVE